MQILSLILSCAFALEATAAVNQTQCKANPLDSTWPRYSQWQALNESIDGALISTSPVAASCWNNSSFESPYSCQTVESNWSSSIFHAAQPESIGAWVFANNSCIPPTESGSNEDQGCRLGGLPSYIVNATSECQVATAMKWASERNVRIVVKGTGHDLNGRSSGAFSLSIWMKSFQRLERNSAWKVPGTSNNTEDVIIAGSGHGWGDVLDFALSQGRVVTTGQDPSVGLGGYIQGGGHGPIASTHGLAAQQVLQATIVTTEGDVLVANADENNDLFWAIRGGGGGQYGVVTEYVIRHFPAPADVNFGSITVAPTSEAGANASWSAAAELFRALPDLMDAGVAGAMSVASGSTGQKFNPAAPSWTSGAVVMQALWSFNMSVDELDRLINPVIENMRAHAGNTSVSISYSASPTGNYSTFYKQISGSNTAGSGGVSSSRLLGRRHIEIPHENLRSYLQRAVTAQNETAGTYMTVGLSGGSGVINHPESDWGALIPAWKSAYLHLFVGGASAAPNSTVTPSMALAENAKWLEEHKEKLWKDWAPDSGSYMNEGNPYSANFKDDFYGPHYERLKAIKAEYDPTESLFVLSGVGSDHWDYDLQTGRLCMV